MKIVSNIETGGCVAFPAFQAERIYMVPFTKRDGFMALPERWRPTAALMMDGIDTDLTAYLMVDQKRLAPGELHRRGGVHVDGNWVSQINDHRPNGPGHNHPPAPPPGHRHHLHFYSGYSGSGYAPETILLAANVEACKAYIGEFDGTPALDGDCSHISGCGREVIMRPNRVYRCTATTLHESLPVAAPCERTVVRINIPGLT